MKTTGVKVIDKRRSAQKPVKAAAPVKIKKRILEPIYDRIIVKRAEKVEKIGQVYLADQAKEPPQEGRVLFVGGGAPVAGGGIRALLVAVGDEILFGKYAGTEVNIDGEDLLILREDEVIAILR